MTYSEILAAPVLFKLKRQLNLTLAKGEYELLDVDDRLSNDTNVTGRTVDESRCVYDFITTDTNGLRIRMIVKQGNPSLGDLNIDLFNRNQFDDNRTVYMLELRIQDDIFKSGNNCIKLDDNADSIRILLTAEGEPILTEDGDYILY